jgi:hypothetical protein
LAATPITGLVPTNAGTTAQVLALQTALTNWAANQAASPGNTSYANLYLNLYTGGRIYLSDGQLGLGATGEPTPAAPTDSAYNVLYSLFEPYIGAQVGGSTVPGNGADITYIDWFSFPITLKAWYYDFAATTPPTALTSGSGTTNEELGGGAASIYEALVVGSYTTPTTNLYPNGSLPPGNTTAAQRLAGPTMAAAAASYYTDPATDPFPYHYFDDYLTYLQGAQAKATSLVTLTGNFAGIGSDPITPNVQPQNFTFTLDFSQIATESNTYPSGTVTQIAPQSAIVLSGYTDKFGTASAPITITLPWAKGTPTYVLQTGATTEALAAGWLALPKTVPTAASGIYASGGTSVAVTAADGDNPLPSVSSDTLLQLYFSVNTNPVSGTLDDLYQGGAGKLITCTGLTGLTLTDSAQYSVAYSSELPIYLVITADKTGMLSTIQINDMTGAPGIVAGSTWTIPANTVGLGNNQAITVALAQDPPLRSVFIQNSATYLATPTSLSVTLGTVPAGGASPGAPFSLTVNESAVSQVGWQPDTDWTTLCQPAGIYGANTGYAIAGITGANASYNGDVEALTNDVFGWIVADVLAALNTGMVGSPVQYGNTGNTIGNSPGQWFVSGNNPYTNNQWGANAWIGVKNASGQPVTNFWNTWAYNLAAVAAPNSTDAYGFAFSDRFQAGILLGFNPPPASPASAYPVLLEVIVSDPPVFPQ